MHVVRVERSNDPFVANHIVNRPLISISPRAGLEVVHSLLHSGGIKRSVSCILSSVMLNTQ